MIVWPETVAMGGVVAKKAPLKHLVRRGSNPWHKIGGGESGLFYFCKVVFRIAVKHHAAYGDGWIVCVRPDLGDVEGIEAVALCFLGCHDLYFQPPGWVVTSLNGII